MGAENMRQISKDKVQISIGHYVKTVLFVFQSQVTHLRKTFKVEANKLHVKADAEKISEIRKRLTNSDL